MTITIALVLVAWIPLCSVLLSPKKYHDAFYTKLALIGAIQTALALILNLQR